jgi:1,4-alpha-glucan branching enzyme
MTKKPGSETKRKRIDFLFDAPDAAAVFLAGSFNGWSLRSHPMKKSADGIWKKTMILPPGDYEYKFWVDGRWREDPRNERCRTNCFGSLNSIVCVHR